jgi:hypothetical protein
MALALRRAKTRETLLWAGGLWDEADQRFLDKRDPETVAVVDLEESQVEYTLWFAEFLADFREGYPRNISLALAAGDRRAGKTFDVYLCQIAALVDVPRHPSGMPAIGWTISQKFRARDELDQLVTAYIPAEWYHHQRAPEHRFTFKHGSILRNLSADDPDDLKQGRVDWLLYNEPQLMSARAIKNGLYGTADNGGLCMLAANPPSDPSGEWLIDLKEAIEEDPDIRPIARFFNFSSKDNTKIDAPARKRVAKLAQKIDPDAADADAEGEWKRWGLLACPKFNGRTLDKGGLCGPPPKLGLKDVTRAVTEAAFWTPYDYVIGGDFQKSPQAAVVYKIFEDHDGSRIWWVVDEVLVKGTEIHLSTEIFAKGYRPETAMWIGDCSGSWQGAERIEGRTSFNLLEGEGWRVEAAAVVKTAKAEHPKNPDVGQRLKLLYRLQEARRWRVDGIAARFTAASHAKCQLRTTDYGKRIPKGVYAHAVDASCYPIWRLEPVVVAAGPTDVAGFGGIKNFTREGSPFPTRR